MNKHLLLTSIILFVTVVSQAQWQPDVRLTNDTLESEYPSLSISGQGVHLVWEDNRDGNEEIYYKNSIDAGVNWGTDTRLTSAIDDSDYPSVAVSGQVVHVVWEDNRDGNSEIYYKRSTDGGLNWGADTRLTNDTVGSYKPSVSVSGTVVHVVWQDDRDGNSEIYFKRSTDGGVSWAADTRLTNDPDNSDHPSVTVSSQVVHVVWQDDRHGNDEIYYKRSTDGGVSWGTDTRLTNAPTSSFASSISVFGSAVHVVWEDFRDMNGGEEIYHKRSTDGGVSWGMDTRLTNDFASSDNPSVSVSGQVVHVLWEDDRDGNDEIYYKHSLDGGVSWGADTRLTNDPASSGRSSVSVSDTVVHVVWQDYRDGNDEIYYKRDPIGNPVGIDDVSATLNMTSISPNPISGSTVISFSLSQSKNVSLSIFDVNGRMVTTLADKIFVGGKNEISWNAAAVNAGIYFLKLQTAEIMKTEKLIVAK